MTYFDSDKKPSSNWGKGVRALIASAFAFSLMTVCVKNLKGELPVAQIVLIRSIISLLITRLMIRKVGISPWGQKRILLIFRGMLGTGALFCIFIALQELPLASATIIQYTYPIFVTIAAALLLGESIKRRVSLAILLGLLGIILVVKPNWDSQPLSLASISIALAGAILTALAYVCVRALSKYEHPLVIIYHFPLISIPICIPFLVVYGFVMPDNSDWIWLLGVGLLTQLGQMWITKGLTILKASEASAINYIQVFFATAWGVLLFAEPLNQGTFFGSILILIATIFSVNSGQRLSINIEKESSL